MFIRPRARDLQLLLTIAALVVATGCAARTNPALGEVRLALRVKTAIINDAVVGTLPVDVRATGDVVTLTGYVRTEGDRQRLIDLAQSVTGVADVISSLMIDPDASQVVPPVESPPAAAAGRGDGPLGWVGLGASIHGTPATGAGLGSTTGIGPLLRLRVRNGFGPTIGFSWMDLRINSNPDGAPGLGHLRLRPLMVGLAFGRTRGKTGVSASLVGGWSINEIRADPDEAGPLRAIHATSSFAWRPGLSIWHDVTPRIGVNGFVGGLFTEPVVTFAADDRVETMRMRSGALIISVGVAYWLF